MDFGLQGIVIVVFRKRWVVIVIIPEIKNNRNKSNVVFWLFRMKMGCAVHKDSSAGGSKVDMLCKLNDVGRSLMKRRVCSALDSSGKSPCNCGTKIIVFIILKIILIVIIKIIILINRTEDIEFFQTGLET